MESSDKKMVQFSEVSKFYGKKHVLSNLTLMVTQGEFVFITGPSGAGKSTLLKLIYCSERADSGKIIIADWDITKLRQKIIPRLRRNIGMVFQNFRLFFNKTVFENVELALRFAGMHPHKIRGYVNEVLDKVKLLHTANTFPQYLSGGEQQRIVIARAMVIKPMLLLADEPTGNLDPESAKGIVGLFRDMNSKGTTILFATHSPDLYRGSGDRVLFVSEKYVDRDYAG
jgi:cell division transport system ATP-binding protein